LATRRRTQCCVAVSADEHRWFLLNVSPDIRTQLEGFAPLLPRESVRSTGVEAVLLTSADLDHTLGLLVLREGERMPVHATPAVREALMEGLRLGPVLESYCGIEWRIPPVDVHALPLRDGAPSGLSYAAFPVAGKPARYREGRVVPSPEDNVGYLLLDDATGGQLVFIPTAARLDASILAGMRRHDLLLLDGTFWSKDEMITSGVGRRSAAEMGHLPVGGPDGSLAFLRSAMGTRAVYIHMNNTNPMLVEDSTEWKCVHETGAEIGRDDMDFEV
jgi:pyrroloquinoline quinone biosynthesis protein B